MKNNMEKLYKLKTDLPTFKAGDLFYLDRNRSLRHKETDIVAYHYSTLDKFPDALERFWEPVEEELKRWRAKRDRKFFFVDCRGVVLSGFDSRDSISSACYALGNYFKTEEEAQALADYLKALAVVRDDAKGFKPDWANDTQCKFYVYYSHRQKRLSFECLEEDADNGVFGLPYFAEPEDAVESIDKHEKEWETIFGIKDKEEE